MQALDLRVHHALAVHLRLFLFRDTGKQLIFLFALDGDKFGYGLLLTGKVPELGQFFKILPPFFADAAVYERAKFGIRQHQPPPLRHSVGDVREFFGHMPILRGEQFALDDLRMDIRHAVDFIGNEHRGVRHGKGLIFRLINRGLLDFGARIAEFFVQPRLRVRKRPQDPRDIGQNFTHEPRVPAFQRLGQNGVVCVIERLFGDLHRAHVRNALFHQHADEFGNGEHGMRIVELYGAILRKGRKVAVQPFMLFYDVADGRGGKKVFLADAQKFSLLGIVRGIENAADLFRAFAPLRLIEA